MMLDRPRPLRARQPVRPPPPPLSYPRATVLRPQRLVVRLSALAGLDHRLRGCGLASLGLHLLIGALVLGGSLLLWPGRPREQPIYADIEMVQEHAGRRAAETMVKSGHGADPLAGAPANPAQAAAAPAATPQRPPTPPAQASPAASTAQPDGALPPAAAPSPPQPARPPAPAPAPPTAQPTPPAAPSQSADPAQTRLGDAEDAGNWQARGAHLVPPGPDSTVHNRPPVYPPLAAKYREEGTVILNVLVAPDGSARSVEVIETSGYERLDTAAKEAVSHWHFRPGQQDGVPVESYYPVHVQFDLN